MEHDPQRDLKGRDVALLSLLFVTVIMIHLFRYYYLMEPISQIIKTEVCPTVPPELP